MMRSKPASSMQKTYDDCYLVCSTAVYFESKNNESEALRSWRSALDQIYYHNAYRVPSSWRPRNETETALQESLRQMELQCKERVDLLEALRESRAEAKEGSSTNVAAQRKPSASGPSLHLHENHPTQPQAPTTSSWLGGGTIAPVEYPDPSRPQLPSRPPPKRPSFMSKKSSSNDVPRTQSSPQVSTSSAAALSPPTSSLAPHGSFGSEAVRKTSRTPSPEKKPGMLRTLRGPGKEKLSSSKLVAGLRSRPPQASTTAAGLAWGTITQRTSMDQTSGDASGLGLTPISSNALWDPQTRSFTERPSSRDVRPDLPKPKSSETLSRLPSPSEHYPSRQSSVPQDMNRAAAEPPPYHDHTSTLHSVQAIRSFANSMENLNATSDHHGPLQSPPMISTTSPSSSNTTKLRRQSPTRTPRTGVVLPAYRKEYPPSRPSNYKKPPNAAPPSSYGRTNSHEVTAASAVKTPPVQHSKPKAPLPIPRKAVGAAVATSERPRIDKQPGLPNGEHDSSSGMEPTSRRRKLRSKDVTEPKPNSKAVISPILSDSDSMDPLETPDKAWQLRVANLLKNLPAGVDEGAAKQILNEIVIQGDEVHWDDVAGLEIAKDALKETVVYPFLRPDLFMGLREPARGMLLFGPPGTGKTMLARAVATESRSTFFAISASSLTSKYLGESEKLVRALFGLAKALAPSIIFVDEIDSLLSARGGGSEHEATRRIKTEFLIQWSDLAKAAAGRERDEKDKERGDASRVLVLAATNLPWAIDEAARRRFVRRQYIPLPEDWVRKSQLGTLLSHQKTQMGETELDQLVVLTDGFSGSDITALAKDAAMGPLRSLGARLLHMSPEDIRPISMVDFQNSLVNIRPSVSKAGLKEFEDWAKDFGERGG